MNSNGCRYYRTALYYRDALLYIVKKFYATDENLHAGLYTTHPQLTAQGTPRNACPPGEIAYYIPPTFGSHNQERKKNGMSLERFLLFFFVILGRVYGYPPPIGEIHGTPGK